MKFLYSLLAVHLLVIVSSGQSVKMPDKLEAKAGRLTQVEIVYDGSNPQVVVLGKDVDYFREQSDKPLTISLRVLAYVDQEVTVVAWCVKDNKSSPPAICKILIGKGPTPVPPGPDPGPNPPGPDPTPNPVTAPINLPGNAVLIVEEKGERGKLPSSQLLILNGETVRNYLNKSCQSDPTRADWKAWRQYDKDTDVTGENKVWQDAFNKVKGKELPYLLISNGKTGYEGKLPVNPDEMIKLLQQHGVKP